MYHNPAKYSYDQTWLGIHGRSHLVFEIKACKDAHVGLGAILGNSESRMYELVIGQSSNTKTSIRRQPQQATAAIADTPDILNCDELRAFWVRWYSNHLEIGKGSHVGLKRIIDWQDTEDAHGISAVSFTAYVDSTADWRLSYLDGKPIQLTRPSKHKTPSKHLYNNWTMLANVEDVVPTLFNSLLTDPTP